MIINTETDYLTQTNKIAMAAALWISNKVRVNKGKRGEKKIHSEKEELILPN